jgi:membrane-bound lytic murein transglycosylase F
LVRKFFILITIIGAIILSCSDNTYYRHKKNNIAFDLDSIGVRGRLVNVSDFRDTRSYALNYSKYFTNSHSGTIIRSDYYALNAGRISSWDNIIKVFSDSIKWDWRLLASLICQESRFIPDVKSRAGAYGLMQIMPETGKNLGIDITSSPHNNIEAGSRYINRLHSIFDPKIPDENERTKFILASYNAGPGHVIDAMKLAEKNGKNPTIWDDNVAVWLLKKSESKYYTDAVVKNGYFRGKESIAFVNEVLERYEHYKNIITEDNEPLSLGVSKESLFNRQVR